MPLRLNVYRHLRVLLRRCVMLEAEVKYLQVLLQGFLFDP
jgi:hypothetical protein